MPSPMLYDSWDLHSDPLIQTRKQQIEDALKSIQSITKTDGLSSFLNKVQIEKNKSIVQPEVEAKANSPLFSNLQWVLSLPSTIIEALAIAGPFEVKLYVLLTTRRLLSPHEQSKIDPQHAAYVEGLKQTDAGNAIAIFEGILKNDFSSEQKRGALLRLGNLYCQTKQIAKALECYKNLLDHYYAEMDPFSRRELAQQLASIIKQDPSLTNILDVQFNKEFNRTNPCVHVLNAIVEGSLNKNELFEKMFSKAQALFIDHYTTKGPYHRREAIEFFATLPDALIQKNCDTYEKVLCYLLECELQHKNTNPKNIELLMDSCLRFKFFNKATFLHILNGIHQSYQNQHDKKQNNKKSHFTSLAINKILLKFLDKTAFNDDVIECLLNNFSIEAHSQWPTQANVELFCTLFEKHKLYEKPQQLKRFLDLFGKLHFLYGQEVNKKYLPSNYSNCINFITWLDKMQKLAPAETMADFNITKIEIYNNQNSLSDFEFPKIENCKKSNLNNNHNFLNLAHQLIVNLPPNNSLNTKTCAEVFKKLGKINDFKLRDIKYQNEYDVAKNNIKQYYLTAGDAEALFSAAQMTPSKEAWKEKLRLLDQALKAAWKENDFHLFIKILSYLIDRVCGNEYEYSHDKDADSYGDYCNRRQDADSSFLYAFSMISLKKDDLNFQKQLCDLALKNLGVFDKNNDILNLLAPYFDYNEAFLKKAYSCSYPKIQNLDPQRFLKIKHKIDQQFEVKKAADGIQNIANLLMKHQDYLKPHSDLPSYIEDTFFRFLLKQLEKKNIDKNDFKILFTLPPNLKDFLLGRLIGRMTHRLQSQKITKDSIHLAELRFLLLNETLQQQNNSLKLTHNIVIQWIDTIKLLPESSNRKELINGLMLYHLSNKTNRKITRLDLDMSNSSISDSVLSRLGLPLSLINQANTKIDRYFGNNLKKIYLSAMVKLINSAPIQMEDNTHNKMSALYQTINKQLPLANEKSTSCFTKFRSEFQELIHFYETASAEYVKSPIQNPHAFLLAYLDQYKSPSSLIKDKLKSQVLEGMQHALGFNNQPDIFKQWLEKLRTLITETPSAMPSHHQEPLFMRVPSAPFIPGLSNSSESKPASLLEHKNEMYPNLTSQEESEFEPGSAPTNTQPISNVVKITPGEEVAIRCTKEGDIYISSKSGLFSKVVKKSEMEMDHGIILKLI